MKTIYTSGVLIVIISLLGVPSSWKNFLFLVLGVLIVLKAFYIQRSNAKTKNKALENDVSSSFKQNKNFSDEDAYKVTDKLEEDGGQ